MFSDQKLVRLMSETFKAHQAALIVFGNIINFSESPDYPDTAIHLGVKAMTFHVFVAPELLTTTPQRGDRAFFVAYPVGRSGNCQYRATWAAIVPGQRGTRI